MVRGERVHDSFDEIVSTAQIKLQEYAVTAANHWNKSENEQAIALEKRMKRMIQFLRALDRREYYSDAELDVVLSGLIAVGRIVSFAAFVPIIGAARPAILFGAPGSTGAAGADGNNAANLPVVMLSNNSEHTVVEDVDPVLGGQRFTLDYDQYVAPVANMVINSATVYEVGTLNDVSFTVKSTKGNKDITDRNVTSPGSITLVNSPLSDPGDETFLDSNTSTNKSYAMNVTDGVTSPDTDTETIKYYYPTLYGSNVDPNYNVYQLTKILTAQASRTVTLAGTAVHQFFAYVDTYDDLSQIKDQNGFDVTNAWVKVLKGVSSSGLDNNWINVGYKVYRTISPTTINTKPFQFIY